MSAATYRLMLGDFVMAVSAANPPAHTQADPLVIAIGHRGSVSSQAHFYVEFFERVVNQPYAEISYRPHSDGSAWEPDDQIFNTIRGAFDYLASGAASLGIKDVFVGTTSLAAEVKHQFRHRVALYLSEVIRIVRLATGRQIVLYFNRKYWSEEDICAISLVLPEAIMVDDHDDLKRRLYERENHGS